MSIQTSEACDKVASALVHARAKITKVAKGGTNTYDKYNYASLEDFVNATEKVLAEHGLMVSSSARSCESLPERKTSAGKTEYVVRVGLDIRAFHESGQWIQVSAYGEGQDRADKAVYKAKTGARKYGLSLLLGLATSDDPESDTSVGVDDAPPAQRQVAVKPQQTPSLKRQFVDAVRNWAQVAAEDLGGACKQVAKAAGVPTDTPDGDAAWTKATEYVVKNASKPFIEWSKEQAK